MYNFSFETNINLSLLHISSINSSKVFSEYLVIISSSRVNIKLIIELPNNSFSFSAIFIRSISLTLLIIILFIGSSISLLLSFSRCNNDLLAFSDNFVNSFSDKRFFTGIFIASLILSLIILTTLSCKKLNISFRSLQINKISCSFTFIFNKPMFSSLMRELIFLENTASTNRLNIFSP